jgi:hypothetical protein
MKTPAHRTVTVTELKKGDLAMIVSEHYPNAYHRPVLEVRLTVFGAAIRWFDRDEIDDRPLVNYGRTATFDVARDLRCIKRK